MTYLSGIEIYLPAFPLAPRPPVPPACLPARPVACRLFARLPGYRKRQIIRGQ